MKIFILQTGTFDQTIPLNLSPRSSTLIYLNYAKTKKVELEGKLTLEECRKTLMALGNGKGNGEDGRLQNFINAFSIFSAKNDDDDDSNNFLTASTLLMKAMN